MLQCGQLVTVLRQVRARGTSEGSGVAHMNFSRMLLVMATIVSLAYAHVYCYLTVDELWALCHATARKTTNATFLSVAVMGVVKW